MGEIIRGSECPGIPRPRKWPYLIALGACLAAVYGVTMPRTVALEDSGEFIAVATYAGIAHPPGYPLYTMLAHAFTWLPLGSAAERVYWFSALAAAGACMCVFLCAHRLTGRLVPSLCAALALGVSSTFWSQAIVADVYSLHALLYFAALAVALRLDLHWSRAGLRALAFAVGLALANHWPLTLLGGIGLLLVLARPGDIRQRLSEAWADAPALALCAGAALLSYAYLPLRSLFDPEMSAYGPIDSVRLFIAYLTREPYGGAETSATAGVVDALRFIGFFFRSLAGEFSLAGAVVLPFGFLASFRFLPRHWALALIASFLSSSVLIHLFWAVEYQRMSRDIFSTYQLVPMGVAALYLACAFLWLDRLGIRRPWIAALAAAVLVGASGASNFSRNDQSRERFASEYARSVLGALPPLSVLLAHTERDLGPLTYAYYIEGVRRDVLLYSLNGTLFSNRLFHGLTSSMDERRAALAQLIERKGRVFATHVGQLAGIEPLEIIDHGLFYEVLGGPDRAEWQSERDALREERLASARRFLDAALREQLESPEKRRWTYLRSVILGDFCRLLIREGVDHPMLHRGGHCSWALASDLAQSGRYEEAVAEFDRVLDRDFDFWDRELQMIYAQRLEAGAAAIRAQGYSGDELRRRLREVALAARPGVERYPLCDNRALVDLLGLVEEGVDVDLSDLLGPFERCEKLRPLLFGYYGRGD